MLNAAEKIRFWTGIMRDHGEFILTSLAYNEQEAIVNARQYRNAFASLHERSKALASFKDANAINVLVDDSLALLCNFINFKKVLLSMLLQCQLKTSLPPTFYNHMINEAMEFYKALLEIRCNYKPNPLQENLNLHRIWLPDAAGHAATIACDLDPVEKLLIKEAQEFEKSFNHLAIKTEELSKMLIRTCLKDGALKYLNEQATMKICEFICFLDKIRRLVMECKVLSVLMPLIPDHMIREENYYLLELKSVEQGK